MTSSWFFICQQETNVNTKLVHLGDRIPQKPFSFDFKESGTECPKYHNKDLRKIHLWKTILWMMMHVTIFSVYNALPLSIDGIPTCGTLTLAPQRRGSLVSNTSHWRCKLCWPELVQFHLPRHHWNMRAHWSVLRLVWMTRVCVRVCVCVRACVCLIMKI